MRIAWTRQALRQLDQIQDHIAVESPRAAHALVSQIIDRTEAALSETPNLGRIGRVSNTRELVLSGTPYIVVYRLNERVEIIAVIHAARNWPEDFS